MAQNDFLTWATGANANVLSQAQFATLPNRASGVVAGPASALLYNKQMRQASIISSMIAQFINDRVNADVIDDGTIATIEANFIAAVRSVFSVANTGVIPGTYGPTMTLAVQADGRITALSNSGLGATGVQPGQYQAATLTVQADGRVTQASANNLQLQALPVGTMAMWAGPTAPQYYVLCDGRALSRSTYSALYAQIGTLYGSGDGSSTFNIPDMRGRVPAGPDGGTARLNVFNATLGAAGGTQLLHAHGHLINDPGHAHVVSDPGHAHAIADPGHVHGVGDPSHAHAVADPGHLHQEQYFNSAFGNNPGPGASGSAGAVGNAGLTTTGSGVGVGIYGAFTGVYLGAAGTGIGIYAALTGIGTLGNATGVTVQVNGSGNQQNVQPTQCVNFIIFTGVP